MLVVLDTVCLTNYIYRMISCTLRALHVLYAYSMLKMYMRMLGTSASTFRAPARLRVAKLQKLKTTMELNFGEPAQGGAGGARKRRATDAQDEGGATTAGNETQHMAKVVQTLWKLSLSTALAARASRKRQRCACSSSRRPATSCKR